MDYKAKVIINADDFGENENINRAILESFQLGLITTTSLLINRPGFNEACESAHENKVLDRIGLHLNLTQGKPLTEPIKKHPKFYSEGRMYRSFKGHLLNSEESRVVYKEFQAQLDKCKRGGINPTHIDSHHGFHNYWDIGKVVIELALRNKIPAVRLRVNWGINSKKGRGVSNKIYDLRGKVYSMLSNYRLGISGLAKTKYFCEIMNVTPELLSKNAFIEVNTHPWMNERNIIIDSCVGERLIDLKEKHLPTNHFSTYKSITQIKKVVFSLFNLTLCFVYNINEYLPTEIVL
jgi:chitin disaccharide deacetylase